MTHPADVLIVDGLISPRKIQDVEAFEGYDTVLETAKRWQTSARNVTRWASEGRIPGAFQFGKSLKRPWVIPKSAEKPEVPQGRPARQLVLVVEEEENSAERAALLKETEHG